MRRNLSMLAILITASLLAQAKPAWISPGDDALPLGNGPSGQSWLAGNWQSHPDSGLSDQQLQSGDGSDWSNTTVPSTWNKGDFSSASMSGKVAWYKLNLPSLHLQDQLWFVRFDGIAGRSQFWLNGRQIAISETPYLPVVMQLNDLHADRNVLVIKVDNRRDPLQLPPAKKGSGEQPFGDGWWNWGGIVRGARIWSVHNIKISDVAVDTSLSTDKAMATVKAVLSNPSNQTSNILASAILDGQTLASKEIQLAAGASTELSWQTAIDKPHLWSPQDPHLVPLEISASGARGTDRWLGQTGLKSVEVKAGHLFLNGQALRLWGVNLHEHTADGWASSQADQDLIIKHAASLGGNLIRSHYPLSDYILQQADQLGLLVWDEIPVWQPVRATIASSIFQARAAQALKSTILRDRIHPAVITWSIGNEYQLKNHSPGLEKWTALAHSIAQRLDPTRPLSVAVQPDQIGFAAWKPLGLIGVNSYIGWYYSSLKSLPMFLKSWRAKTPANQAIVVSEFGAEATASAAPSAARGSFAYQNALLGTTIQTISNNKDWDGGMVWVLRDFACRPGWTGKNPLEPNPPFNNKGLFSADWQAKPSWATVSSWYHRLLAAHWKS